MGAAVTLRQRGSTNDDNDPDARRGPGITFDEFKTSPLDGGYKASPEEADALVPFDVYMPASSWANRQAVVDSWVWAEAGQVAMSFESGIVMILEEPQFPDARSEFEGLVKSGSTGGEVVEVQGVAALLIEPGTDITKQNPGSLQFVKGDESPTVLDGVSVTLYGDEVSGAQLMTIADSIK